MPKIKLKIGDRPYEISCNDGEEERIEKLAIGLDVRVNRIAQNLGQASESMVLVVTALMMEDEIRNLSARDAAITTQQTEAVIKDRINRCIAEALVPLTEKLESLANSLEVEYYPTENGALLGS